MEAARKLRRFAYLVLYFSGSYDKLIETKRIISK